mmetsp:Transcript_125612/g.361145  ORF Transcript_125612/g.361145 Transcript_125612/m.361145 type:complete len:208 (+) Transcript_125612:61-684(+)
MNTGWISDQSPSDAHACKEHENKGRVTAAPGTKFRERPAATWRLACKSGNWAVCCDPRIFDHPSLGSHGSLVARLRGRKAFKTQRRRRGACVRLSQPEDHGVQGHSAEGRVRSGTETEVRRWPLAPHSSACANPPGLQRCRRRLRLAEGAQRRVRAGGARLREDGPWRPEVPVEGAQRLLFRNAGAAAVHPRQALAVFVGIVRGLRG